MAHIAYKRMIDWSDDLDKMSYETYSPYFPELTKEMNFLDIQEIVNKKPHVARLAANMAKEREESMN